MIVTHSRAYSLGPPPPRVSRKAWRASRRPPLAVTQQRPAPRAGRHLPPLKRRRIHQNRVAPVTVRRMRPRHPRRLLPRRRVRRLQKMMRRHRQRTPLPMARAKRGGRHHRCASRRRLKLLRARMPPRLCRPPRPHTSARTTPGSRRQRSRAWQIKPSPAESLRRTMMRRRPPWPAGAGTMRRGLHARKRAHARALPTRQPWRQRKPGVNGRRHRLLPRRRQSNRGCVASRVTRRRAAASL